MVYLDNHATTQVEPHVLQAMILTDRDKMPVKMPKIVVEEEVEEEEGAEEAAEGEKAEGEAAEGEKAEDKKSEDKKEK